MSNTMMAMTTNNSTSVKPRRWLDMRHHPIGDMRRCLHVIRREGSAVFRRRLAAPFGVRFAIIPYVPSCIVVFFLFAGCGSHSTRSRLEDRSVAELADLLQAEGAERRAQAAHALGEKGPAAAEAVAALARLLKDSDVRARLEAAVALGKIGSEARGAVPELAAALRDKEATVRRQSAAALGRIGPDARAALPALEKARQDEAPIVRRAAGEAVELIKSSKHGGR